VEIEIAALDELADYLRDHVAHNPVTLRLFHCLENVGDQVIVGDSHPRGVGLLAARFRQSIHRLDCAKHVHMRDAFALGVVARFDVGTGEDGDDPVLQVDAVFSIVVLAFLGIDDRIGEPEVGAFIVVLVDARMSRLLCSFAHW
jgi:hypothetical protein